MSWFDAIGALPPLEFMLYVVSPPIFVVALVACWFKWRDDHRGHPAE